MRLLIGLLGMTLLAQAPVPVNGGGGGGSSAPATFNNTAVATPSAPAVTPTCAGPDPCMTSWKYGVFKVNAYGSTPVSALTTGTLGTNSPTSSNYWNVALPTDMANRCGIWRDTNSDDPGPIGTGYLVTNAPAGQAGSNYGILLTVACDGTLFRDFDFSTGQPYESFSGYYTDTPTARPPQPVSTNTTTGQVIAPAQLVTNAIGPAAYVWPSDQTSFALGAWSFAGGQNSATGSANFNMALGPYSYIAGGANNLTIGQLSSLSGGCAPNVEPNNLGGCTNVGIGGYINALGGTNLGIDGIVTGLEGISVGRLGQANGDYSVSVGFQSATTSSNTISLGCDANFNYELTPPANALTVGSNLSDTVCPGITDWFAATSDVQPNPITIHPGDVFGTNIAGGTLNLAGGRSTGTGAPGEVHIQAAPIGLSGQSQNVLADVAVFAPGSMVLSNGSGIKLGSASSTLLVSDLKNTGTITLGAIPDGTCTNGTFTLTGAATGDALAPVWPTGLNAATSGRMLVSAANTVTVVVCNESGGSITPGALTYGALVIH